MNIKDISVGDKIRLTSSRFNYSWVGIAETKEKQLFIGSNWNGGKAGYFLNESNSFNWTQIEKL